MVKAIKRWALAEEFRKLYGKSLGLKLQTLWRKGWIEIPEVLASTGLAFIGLGLCGYVAYKTDENEYPKYYRDIQIYRPDDPRVKSINNVSRLD